MSNTFYDTQFYSMLKRQLRMYCIDSLQKGAMYVLFIVYMIIQTLAFTQIIAIRTLWDIPLGKP